MRRGRGGGGGSETEGERERERERERGGGALGEVLLSISFNCASFSSIKDKLCFTFESARLLYFGGLTYLTRKEGTTWIRKATDRQQWKTLMEGYILLRMDKA